MVYHLSLLALEEVGKASMLGARMINHNSLDGSWLDRSLDNHRRKLQWAVWSPIVRIDPTDFEAARQFAERAHAMRLASLYVDPKAELTDLPTIDVVQPGDAEKALALARARTLQLLLSQRTKFALSTLHFLAHPSTQSVLGSC